jgi:hypothetical protein
MMCVCLKRLMDGIREIKGASLGEDFCPLRESVLFIGTPFSNLYTAVKLDLFPSMLGLF